MKKTSVPRQLSFYSRLERIASGMDYFAVSVPLKITRALGTRGPVPVYASVNGSSRFLISLHPVGEGRHYLRIKNQIRKEAKAEEGDRVRLRIAVRDRSKEVSLPADVAKALRAKGVLDAFNSFPIGKRSFTLRQIAAAAKPETRKKRIDAAIAEARKKKR